MAQGKITLYIAASVDGFIADSDGGIEWLEAFEDSAEGGEIGVAYEEFFSDIDCLVMGSTTYEQVLTFGEWPYGDRPTYVLTHRDLPQETDAVEFFEGDVDELAADLRSRYDNIWLVGGAEVAREFLRADQIDELRLSVIPVLLGSGIPLFAASGQQRALKLVDSITDRSGIVEHRYKISP